MVALCMQFVGRESQYITNNSLIQFNASSIIYR